MEKWRLKMLKKMGHKFETAANNCRENWNGAKIWTKNLKMIKKIDINLKSIQKASIKIWNWSKKMSSNLKMIKKIELEKIGFKKRAQKSMAKLMKKIGIKMWN